MHAHTHNYKTTKPHEVFIAMLYFLSSHSTAPDHANFLCRDFESAVLLAAKPPLADLIETIWVIGGRRVYEVN